MCWDPELAVGVAGDGGTTPGSHGWATRVIHGYTCCHHHELASIEGTPDPLGLSKPPSSARVVAVFMDHMMVVPMPRREK